MIPHELDSTQKKNSRETLSLPYLISRFDLFIKHFLIFRVVIFKIIMVRVGEDQGILTLEHQRHPKKYYPNNVRHHYGAEPSLHRSASQSIATLVLIRA